MSLQPFPEIIEVRKFFSRQARLTASLPLQLFKRLADYLNKAEKSKGSDIDLELVFIQDDNGRLILEGSMKGVLLLSCQRCLNSVEHILSSEFRVQILDELKIGGDRELADDELEVVLSVEGKLDLLALVEDEVILSLPLVLYHEEADCNQTLLDLARAGEQKVETKPFAELEDLKNQLKLAKNKM